MPLAAIIWPTKDEQKQWVALVQAKEPLMHGRWGFIDGKNYSVQQPNNADLQNALYNGWLHAVMVTGTLCFSADGCIVWGKHNFVGSWNDAETSRGFQEKLSNPDKNEAGHGVVSDSAFPVKDEMFGLIMTPMKEDELERAHPDARPALFA